MTVSAPKTRIQKRKHSAILEAALDVFSSHGYRGSTLDQIASAAGISKPNLLYYFPSKEAIHVALLSGLMETWLNPLKQLNASGQPIEEIVSYVKQKLDMSRRFPRESRLFANEIVQGAPRILGQIKGPLRALVAEKSAVISNWSKDGHIAKIDPTHLIFSIWATTQHYADFDVQVRGILDPSNDDHFAAAEDFLERMYRNLLAPD
jgi:TetR/AcrR family transcriptional regulator